MRIICMDSLEFLKNCKTRFDCIFADPPDNLGLGYEGYLDNRLDYYDWLEAIITQSIFRAPVVWVSYYYKHDLEIKYRLRRLLDSYPRNVRTYIWRFHFGRYFESDNPNGYRPIIRISKKDWKPIMSERVQSVRQKIGDARASGPRVPDDVWEYSRVQGNSGERRSWHPTQHPEALYRRILRMSIPIVDGQRSGTFLDLFAGTGTCFRVAWDSIDVTGVELSPTYVRNIGTENPRLTIS